MGALRDVLTICTFEPECTVKRVEILEEKPLVTSVTGQSNTVLSPENNIDIRHTMSQN